MRPLPFRGLPAALAATLAGVLACADPLAPRPPAARPAAAAALPAAGDGPARVEVKFREGRGVRLVGGALRAADGRALDGAERAVRRRGGGALRARFADVGGAADALGRAARTGGRAAPDLAAWYLVDAPDAAAAAALAADLRALPDVEAAYPAPAPQEPPGRTAAGARLAALAAPSFAAAQGYFAAPPQGTGADVLRGLPGGDGRDIQVVDLEYAWYYAHEDLGMSEATHHLGGAPYAAFGDDHGTAVLGILGALDDGAGVTGGVPGATIRTMSPFPGSYYDPAAAILLAASRMRRGDVLLVEQQAAGPDGGSAYVPLEWIPSVYDAVRSATSAGIVVVEAAGNGAVDLDGPALAGRFDPSARHSGALVVGAGDAGLARLWFSSYGARVDLQAWGQGVATTGYGGLFGGPKASWYTAGFGGTSSAAAIVAAAAASLQGYARAATGDVLDPAALADLLRRTGRPQAGSFGARIGAAPDLLAAAAALAPAPLAVDILPGSATNPFNPRSRGRLPVAVLATATFDPGALDPATVTLGDGAGDDTAVDRRPNGTPFAAREDVNADGRPDLVLHFSRAALVAAGDVTDATTGLTLSGRDAGGRRYRGSDRLAVVR